MALGSSHVHKARYIFNSQYSHEQVLSLSRWSKSQIKQRFESAMAVVRLRDHRTYAQALISNNQAMHEKVRGHNTAHYTTHKGDPNALNQLVVNTDFNTSEVKGSSINVTKPKHHKVPRVDTGRNTRDNGVNVGSSPQATHTQVSQYAPMAINNRFQVLDTIQEEQPSTKEKIHAYDSHSRTCQLYLPEEFTADPKELKSDPESITPDYTLIPEYQKCKDQIGTKFGCVPLAPIYVYKGPTVHWDYIPDVLTAHKLIRQSGLPNLTFWVLEYQFELI